MFDPTVFDNLKVVLEGAVYDQDFRGIVEVIGRSDRIDLAIMERTFSATIRLKATDRSTAELILSVHAEDWAAEVLERPNMAPGCKLLLRFRTAVERPEEQCSDWNILFGELWGEERSIRQTLSYEFGQTSAPLTNDITVDFGRTFTEELADDLPSLIEHAVETLRRLEESHAESDR